MLHENQYKYFQRWLRYFGIDNKQLEVERKRYEGLRESYIDHQKDPLTIDDETYELKIEIEKDVTRLYPSGRAYFFQNNLYLSIFRNILFIWCKLHPSVSYRQGMHDLVSVILYAELKEYGLHQFMTEFGPIQHVDEVYNDVYYATMSHGVRGYFQASHVMQKLATSDLVPFLEHDTFILFERLMIQMLPLFEVEHARLRTPPKHEMMDEPISSQQLFPIARKLYPTCSEPKSTLQKLCRLVQYRLLRRHDPELCHHLQCQEILPENYALRWCKVLFSREFDFDQLLKLWDAIFATLESYQDHYDTPDLNPSTNQYGPPFLKYVYAAMLISISSELSASDSTGCFELLLNTPDLWKVEHVIELAQRLHNPMLEASKDVDVVKFLPGSLGLVLTQDYYDRLAIKSINVEGQAENNGKIQVGDVVVSINGCPLGSMSTEKIKRYIEMVGKPLFIAFAHGKTLEDIQSCVSKYTPLYLRGEVMYVNAEMTMHEQVMSEGLLVTRNHIGTLFITNYRCMFHQTNAGSHTDGISWQIPVLSIASIEGPDIGLDHEAQVKRMGLLRGGKTAFRLILRCKDTQVVRFSCSNFQSYTKLFKCFNHVCFPEDVLNAFCFRYTPYLQDGVGIEAFDIRSEYERLGFNQPEQREEFKCITQSYKLCESYPNHLIVPASMSDAEIASAAAFRSGGRLPVATWRHPDNGATICRSSQPLVGFKSTRNALDEKLVRLLCCQRSYYILDARGQLAAVGNKAMGKGTENAANYVGANIIFMNIDNIHAIRQSFHAISSIFSIEAALSNDESSSFMSKIDNSGWLKHVRLVIRAATELAKSVHHGRSVLTHCSDGWDRTAQMVSLAEFFLDPFYRTFRGFQVLIEKEWCSFGHQFHTRSGHTQSDTSNDQRSPIFLLWLDCVYQVIRQRPRDCEFNENLLIALADHVYSCKFDNFMFNTERERNHYRRKRKLASIWDEIETNRSKFINSVYLPQQDPLEISFHSKNIRLWDGYFCRFDPTYVPRVPRVQFY